MEVNAIYFRPPAELLETHGIWIGGAWFPFEKGILALPGDGNHEALLPAGFVRVAGPQVPGAEPPAALEEQKADSGTGKPGKAPKGDSGKPAEAS